MTKALAVLAAVAAGLVLAACGGGSDEPIAATETTTQVATTQTGSSADAPTTAEAQTTTEAATGAETAGGSAAGAVIEVVSGEPKGGVQDIEVTKGDLVHIEVEVDEPQEIHMHGYDLEGEATPEAPAVFDFTAEFDGIFDIESHMTEALLARLVVQP
jgi:FtsP/CotA-like multicopper oxidase with cupredoxin domain